jgi:hypothetical protein
VGIVSMGKKRQNSPFFTFRILLAREVVEYAGSFVGFTGLHGHVKTHGLFLIVADQERNIYFPFRKVVQQFHETAIISLGKDKGDLTHLLEDLEATESFGRIRQG